MPAVRPVVSVWNVECSSRRAQGEPAAPDGLGIVPLACWRLLASKSFNRSSNLGKWGKKNYERGLFVTVASILLFTIAAMAQEVRNEVSVQGTGFFTKDSNGNGISRTTTKTGGLEVGYPLSHQSLVIRGSKLRFRPKHSKIFFGCGTIQSPV
jgi:hypothetical protein